MALQDVGAHTLRNIDDQAKVDRAFGAMGEVRDLLRSVNGRATKAFGDALRRGIDAEGAANPVCGRS